LVPGALPPAGHDGGQRALAHGTACGIGARRWRDDQGYLQQLQQLQQVQQVQQVQQLR